MISHLERQKRAGTFLFLRIRKKRRTKYTPFKSEKKKVIVTILNDGINDTPLTMIENNRETLQHNSSKRGFVLSLLIPIIAICRNL